MVRVHEPQSFIEVKSLRTLSVGGELEDVAVGFDRQFLGPPQQLASHATTSSIRRNPHTLDLGTATAFVGEIGNNRKLQGTNHHTFHSRHEKRLADASCDPGKAGTVS